ncbi:MAG TPA: hypothetical protein VHG92_15200, partial [Afifellaceae bacterium]|nr:hypothetical protein [Afifellaceae bacterium]
MRTLHDLHRPGDIVGIGRYGTSFRDKRGRRFRQRQVRPGFSLQVERHPYDDRHALGSGEQEGI